MNVKHLVKKTVTAGTLFLFSWGAGYCQTLSVSGQILSAADKQAITGATISVPGTSRGTVSDGSGHYRIEGTHPGDSLLFSFIGFRKKTIAVGGRRTINVTLEPDISQLNQLVVIGYGEQQKKDITGSVATVKTDQTAALPDYDILQSLQGRVPGMNITTPVRPGENPGILIRGINSISAGNSPLVVVDGIIYNGSLSDFNTNDIASVDVLKDASATAVYGSRAANGVLLITTKTGTSGKPVFNFTTYQGISNPVKLIPVMGGAGYIQKILDYREATGLEADPAHIDQYLTVREAENYKKGLATNWIDQVIRTGVTSNYHLDVSGKTNKTNYYISGTYFNQNGIVVNDDYHRLTLNLNLTNHITSWYSVSVRSMFSQQNWPGQAASLTQAYRQSPYGSLHDSSGPGGYAYFPVGDPLGINPLVSTLIQNKQADMSLRGVFSSNLEVPFIPGLKWTLNYASNLRMSNQEKYLDNETSNAGIVAGGIGTKDETKNVDWTLDNIINYRKDFGTLHSLYLTLLYSREGSHLDYSGLQGNNFFTQVLGYNNLGLAQVQQVSSNYEDQHNVSYMARLNYSYKHTYAVTFTARRDGFSGFSANHKYATFPSVAFAWTATNEPFLKDVSWLNYLKLRFSYGNNGNQAVGRYQSLARMGSDKYVFGDEPITTIYVNSVANNDLTWETTTTKNIGLDFEVLRSRITGSIDAYASETHGILLRRALPEVTGFTDILTNIGKVHNQGLEVSLRSVNIQKGPLRWESALVFSLNRNRIDELTGQGDDIRDGWFIGEPLQSFYGYQTDGIYQLKDTDIPPGFEPGDFRLADTNQDGKITADDRKILGNRLPYYSYSIANTLHFKDFDFYMLINAIQGGHGYYLGNNNATRNVNAPFTTFTERFNIQDVPYWTPKRPSEKYPRINYIPAFPHPILEDRSFVRIQDISLSYHFKKNVLEKIRLSNLTVYASAKNLYTFTKWTGYDPENASTIADFPLMRTYTIGADFSF